MSHIIIIREYRQSDDITVREIVRQSLVSLVTDAFFATLIKEITFQLIVVIAAVMFIFIGVPVQYCLISVPIVIACIYLSVYGSHIVKSIELFQEKPYQCWVAEACEPFFFTQPPDKFSYSIFTEQEMMIKNIDVGSLQRRVIGAVALKNNRFAENSIWLYRLAVDNRYRKKGVANALVNAAVNWSSVRGYDTIELSITENQDPARQLFMNKGFKLRQMYHKQLIGTVLTLLKYQIGLDLTPNS